MVAGLNSHGVWLQHLKTASLKRLGTKELAAGALSLLFCNVTGISIGSVSSALSVDMPYMNVGTGQTVETL